MFGKGRHEGSTAFLCWPTPCALPNYSVEHHGAALTIACQKRLQIKLLSFCCSTKERKMLASLKEEMFKMYIVRKVMQVLYDPPVM